MPDEPEERRLISDREFGQFLRRAAHSEAHSTFGLKAYFNPDNIVEIAKSQFPRLQHLTSPVAVAEIGGVAHLP